MSTPAPLNPDKPDKPDEADDLALIVDGLAELLERRPEILQALLRQLARRAKPPEPAPLAEAKPEAPPYADIQIALEAILLPKYAGLDTAMWRARLEDLESKYPRVVEIIRQQVLWEAKQQLPGRKLVHIKQAIGKAIQTEGDAP
jgi:hypothetical protein